MLFVDALLLSTPESGPNLLQTDKALHGVLQLHTIIKACQSYFHF